MAPEPRNAPGLGPWLLKVFYSGYTGKHSAQPLTVEDIAILDLGLPPESDPLSNEGSDAASVATSFITEFEPAASGLDVDFEAFRLSCETDGWSVVDHEGPAGEPRSS